LDQRFVRLRTVGCRPVAILNPGGCALDSGKLPRLPCRRNLYELVNKQAGTAPPDPMSGLKHYGGPLDVQQSTR
jgi:hypothetical protein